MRFLRRPTDDDAPRCPAGRALVRPHVLFFDEYYGKHEDCEITRVREAVERARARGVPFFDVDPGARDSALPHPAQCRMPGFVGRCRDWEAWERRQSAAHE